MVGSASVTCKQQKKHMPGVSRASAAEIVGSLVKFIGKFVKLKRRKCIFQTALIFVGEVRNL